MKVNLKKILDQIQKKKNRLEEKYSICITTLNFEKQYTNFKLIIYAENRGAYSLDFIEASGRQYTFDLDFKNNYYIIESYAGGEKTEYFREVEKLKNILNGFDDVEKS